MSAQEIRMPSGRGATLAVPAIIGVMILVGLVANSVVVVESGHVGVVRTLRAVHSTPLEEGFHFKKPFLDSVVQMDIRLATSNAKAQAASKDLQIVTTEVTVQYALIGINAPKTYQSIGTRDELAMRLIEPAIQESVKAITAQYTAEELVTQRSEVKLQIHEAIREFIDKTLTQKEAQGAVDLANVAITDFNFSDEFNRSIESKVRAEQEALQAVREKEKLITEAEAAAEQVELAASAKAFEIEAESVARADAIQREAEALRGNPELISLRAVEAWDGTLPKYVGGGGSGAIPFLDISNVIDEPAK